MIIQTITPAVVTMALNPGMITNTITIIITYLNQRHLSPGDHGPESWQNSGPLLKGATLFKLPELQHHDHDGDDDGGGGGDEDDDG